MQWTDEGIVIAVRPHGETSAIVEVFTRQQGRALGLVRGGRSRRIRPVLQAGNHVDVTWKARLEEHLGQMTLELRCGYAAQSLDSRMELAGLSSMCSLLRYLPERDPHRNLYEVTLFVFSFFDDVDVWPALMARWELELLEELGFGLDLKTCAATGGTEDLRYVSPRSGCAVSGEAGAPYADKLLKLPGFLQGGEDRQATVTDIVDALELTGYFLSRDVVEPRGDVLPETRERLLGYLRKKMM